MLLSDDHKEKTQLYHQNLRDFFFFLEVCSFLFCISTDLSTFNLGKQDLDIYIFFLNGSMPFGITWPWEAFLVEAV